MLPYADSCPSTTCYPRRQEVWVVSKKINLQIYLAALLYLRSLTMPTPFSNSCRCLPLFKILCPQGLKFGNWEWIVATSPYVASSGIVLDHCTNIWGTGRLFFFTKRLFRTTIGSTKILSFRSCSREFSTWHFLEFNFFLQQGDMKYLVNKWSWR